MAKSDDKRQAIFDATMKLVSQHGFHRTSMSMIIRESGVCSGSIYHHFKGKDEIIVELYKDLTRKATEYYMADYAPDEPTRVQLRKIVSNYFHYNAKHPMATAFKSQVMSSPYMTADLEAETMEKFSGFADIFEKAKEETLLKDLPKHVVGVFLIDVSNGLVNQASLGNLELTEDLIEAVAESVWQAISA